MPFRGCHTAETKSAISAKLKGRPRSEVTKERISAARQGKPLSKEHRLAQRIGHRRTKLFDPERYAERCARSSEVRRKLWAEGVYDRRGREVGPPHASTWNAVRERCDRHATGNCAFPFCCCMQTEQQQSETPERKAVA